MTRRVLTSPKLSRPVGVFVHGISVSGAKLIYVSGMLARDHTGRITGINDIRAQTDQCLKNIAAVLELEGAGLGDVVKVTVYIRNMGDFAGIHEVRAKYWKSGAAPASTMIEVSRFTEPDALIEIEAVAAVPSDTPRGSGVA